VRLLTEAIEPRAPGELARAGLADGGVAQVTQVQH
jgi:hypothetical protein